MPDSIPSQQDLQFSFSEHFAHDVDTAYELTFYIQLGKSRPARVVLGALPKTVVQQHVNRVEIGHAAILKYPDRSGGKAAAGKLGGAFHEQHHRMARNQIVNYLLLIHGC